MARMIEPETWEDDFFTSLTIFERLVWVGIITGCADDQGRLQDSSALIRSKIFPLDDIPTDDIEIALSKFCLAGKIVRYIAANKRLIQIVNWWKHQKPRWAGQSNYPPPPEWIDRVRFHGAGNEEIKRNWDSIGGFTTGYIAPNTTNDVKDEVKGKGEGEGEGALDPFDLVQRDCEAITGVTPGNKAGLDAIQEIMDMKATRDDIEAGYKWLTGEAGKEFKYYSQLVGPTRTAMSKRLGNKNGNSGGRKRTLTGANGEVIEVDA